MEDEIKQKLNDTLIGMIDDLAKTKDFVIEQAPDVIQQLLLWRFTISFTLWILCILGTIACIYGIYKTRDCIDNPEGVGPFILIFSGIIVMVTTVGIFANTAWLKIWIAPKLFLLEFARGFF